MLVKNKTSITAEAGKQDASVTREFEAPRELVFRAFTEPELVSQWMGPRRLSTTIEIYEAKFGGAYRFTQFDDNGHSYNFRGVFHEVAVPERFIRTFEYEGLPEKGHVALETVKFIELPGGRTKVLLHAVFQSLADRDGMMQSGMERGMNEGYERLDELMEREMGK